MSRSLTIFLMLAAAPLWAQFPTVNNQTSQMKGLVQVAVVFSNGAHAGAHLRVQLRLAITSTLVAMDLTNQQGTVEFEELNVGEYVIRVTGDGIEPAESSQFSVEDGKDFQTVTIMVKPAAGAEPGADVRASSSVAAADLNVPKKAAKEYQHAGEEMAADNYDKAIDHLDKAIAIYPQYSAAYNDLGVCYGHLKEKDKQREALLKAVSVNGHCIPALINLAHMEMKDNQLADALATLNKALTTEPSNVDALSLLTQLDFQQGHYDQTILEAHKVHDIPHHYAIVHYTAAQALDRESRIPEAMVELQLFLQEEPQGPRADVVRKVLAAMQNSQSQADGKVSPAGAPLAGTR